MNTENAIQNRTALLVGEQAMECIRQSKVIIFGVGGVGSWVAESLVRSGVRRLTIVDGDRVCITNVNRQCPATVSTVGMVKVDAMKSRLSDINPEAEVEALFGLYGAQTAAGFHLEDYDYVIDAIDSLDAKAELICHATSLPERVKFFSSMGAALKSDPTQVRVDEFWKVKGCPLARALRQKFKRSGRFPGRKFRVVYSAERLPNLGVALGSEACAAECPVAESCPGQGQRPHEASLRKVQVNGTLPHITAIFGFTLAGLVVQDMCRRAEAQGVAAGTLKG